MEPDLTESEDHSSPAPAKLGTASKLMAAVMVIATLAGIALMLMSECEPEGVEVRGLMRENATAAEIVEQVGKWDDWGYAPRGQILWMPTQSGFKAAYWDYNGLRDPDIEAALRWRLERARRFEGVSTPVFYSMRGWSDCVYCMRLVRTSCPILKDGTYNFGNEYYLLFDADLRLVGWFQHPGTEP